MIDPMDIIQRFGTDATRFTLAAMAAPGTDIAFSESRTDGYRAFANKIWNAARFMFMNVDRVEQAGSGSNRQFLTESGVRASPDFTPATLEDRWILSRFNRVAKDVHDALADLSLSRSGEPHLRFFLGRLLRLVSRTDEAAARSTENGAAAGIACGNLVSLFEAALRLLHPVMPFITEEIWHAVYDGNPPLKSIALAAFPQADETQIDLAAETEMAILQDLIVSSPQPARRNEGRAETESSDSSIYATRAGDSISAGRESKRHRARWPTWRAVNVRREFVGQSCRSTRTPRVSKCT